MVEANVLFKPGVRFYMMDAIVRFRSGMYILYGVSLCCCALFWELESIWGLKLHKHLSSIFYLGDPWRHCKWAPRHMQLFNNDPYSLKYLSSLSMGIWSMTIRLAPARCPFFLICSSTLTDTSWRIFFIVIHIEFENVRWYDANYVSDIWGRCDTWAPTRECIEIWELSRCGLFEAWIGDYKKITTNIKHYNEIEWDF